MSLNQSIRVVDLRIEIGEYCGFDFRERVEDSNSNSLAAIYFTRDQLDQIAQELGLDPTAFATKHDLQNGIRETCGRERRSVDAFDWVELKAIVETAGIPVSDDAFYRLEAGDDESVTAGNSDPSADATGPWSGWGGDHQ